MFDCRSNRGASGTQPRREWSIRILHFFVYKIRAIDKKRPGLRVLIMSGYTEETLTGLGGRADLLQKPFTPRELRRRIREVLDR